LSAAWGSSAEELASKVLANFEAFAQDYNLSEFSVPENQQFSVAMILARHEGARIAEHIDQFQFSAGQKVQVLLAASKGPVPGSPHYQSGGWGKSLAENMAAPHEDTGIRQRIPFIYDRLEYFLGNLSQGDWANGDSVRSLWERQHLPFRMRKWVMAIMPITNPAAWRAVLELSDTTLHTREEIFERLRNLNAEFHLQYSEGFFKSLERLSTRQLRATTLLVFRHRDLYKKAEAPSTLEQLCRDLVGPGLTVRSLKALLDDHSSEFLELVAESAMSSRVPLLEDRVISEEVTTPQNLPKFWEYLRNLRDLQNLQISEYKIADLKEFLPKRNLDYVELNEGLTLQREKLVAKLNSIHESDNQFSWENYSSIRERIGNPETLFWLTNIYSDQGEETIDKALLVKLIRSELDDAYVKHKFRGLPGDVADMGRAVYQLAPVWKQDHGPALVDFWSGEHLRYSLVDVPTEQIHSENEIANLLQEQLRLLNEELTREVFQKQIPDFDSNLKLSEAALLDLMEFKGPPSAYMEDFFARHMMDFPEKARGAGSDIIRRTVFAQLISQALVKLELKNEQKNRALSFLRTLIRKELGLSPELGDRIGQSADQARRIIAEPASVLAAPQAPKALVVTLTPRDLFSMIRVAEWSDAWSCQHYILGGRRTTLLGYVVDSNFLALLSFELRKEAFESESDFETITHAIESGNEPEISLDPNQKIKITIQGRTYWSDPMKFAIRRQMLKLDHSSNPETQELQPILFVGRLYRRNGNWSQPIAERQVYDIAKEVAVQTKARIAGRAYGPSSRNSFGSYDDTSGNIRREIYSYDTGNEKLEGAKETIAAAQKSNCVAQLRRRID
jgi:hypothetical protein